MTRTATGTIDEQRLAAFSEQVLGDAAAAFSAVLVVLGDRLGLYRAMAGGGPMEPGDLASRTGLAERYVREWLNNQAAGGYVRYHPEDGTYDLPAENAAVLADEHHAAFMQGTFMFVPVFARALDDLGEAFRTGDGLPWSAYGPELATALERFLGPTYRHNLVQRWIPVLDGVERRLTDGARAADVGCGAGVTTILMAEAFPASRFWGFDTDGAAITSAEAAASAAGVAGRVVFRRAEAAGVGPGADGAPFAVVTTFNCLHDMGDPLAVARSVRSSLEEGGTWLLVEPRAGDRVEDNLTPFGRMTYGGSTMLCVPTALAQDGGEALGAQAGERRLRRLLAAAGFTRVRRADETGFSLVLEVRP